MPCRGVHTTMAATRDGAYGAPAEAEHVLRVQTFQWKTHGAYLLWKLQVRGYGLSGDAHHITQPPEDGSGAALAVRRALADGALRPADVAYVNAHATGANYCLPARFPVGTGPQESCDAYNDVMHGMCSPDVSWVSLGHSSP